MNNKCTKCGNECNINDTFCQNCGNQLKENSENNSVQSSDSSKASIFAGLALLFFFGGSSISSLISILTFNMLGDSIYYLGILFPVIGIVLMVIGRIKYPKNSFLKATMFSILIVSAMILIAIITFFVFLYGIRDIG